MLGKNEIGEKMGYKSRGKRDGTGPFKSSFRRKGEKKKLGRRQSKGQSCPKR